MRLHPAAEIGQRDLTPLAKKQRTAELRLQLLDCSSKSRLGDVAVFGGARKAQCLRRSKEIPHLVHFHERPHCEPGWAQYSRVCPNTGIMDR